MFSQNFKADFKAVTERLRDGPPFALARFNDGELAILQRKPYKAASGWRTQGDTWIRSRLLAALQYKGRDYYVGISPLCCIPGAPQWYRKHVRKHESELTFATLFFNANYHASLKFFSGFDALKVGCAAGCDVRIPRDAVNQRWDVDAIVDKMLESDRPILLAAGPGACVLAHRYWMRADPASRQSVVDVGAVLDTEIHGQPTRDYQQRDPGAARILRHVCQWAGRDHGLHVAQLPKGTNTALRPQGFNVSTEVRDAGMMTQAAVRQHEAPPVDGTPHAARGLPPKPQLPTSGWLRRKK